MLWLIQTDTTFLSVSNPIRSSQVLWDIVYGLDCVGNVTPYGAYLASKCAVIFLGLLLGNIGLVVWVDYDIFWSRWFE